MLTTILRTKPESELNRVLQCPIVLSCTSEDILGLVSTRDKINQSQVLWFKSWDWLNQRQSRKPVSAVLISPAQISPECTGVMGGDVLFSSPGRFTLYGNAYFNFANVLTSKLFSVPCEVTSNTVRCHIEQLTWLENQNSEITFRATPGVFKSNGKTYISYSATDAGFITSENAPDDPPKFPESYGLYISELYEEAALLRGERILYWPTQGHRGAIARPYQSKTEPDKIWFSWRDFWGSGETYAVGYARISKEMNIEVIQLAGQIQSSKINTISYASSFKYHDKEYLAVSVGQYGAEGIGILEADLA